MKTLSVALGGDGGDELFGGYGHYNRLLKLQAWTNKIPYFARSTCSNCFQCFTCRFQGRNWALSMGVDYTENVPIV